MAYGFVIVALFVKCDLHGQGKCFTNESEIQYDDFTPK